MSSALPYPLTGLRRRKSARGWKEGREDETWEGGKVRIGGRECPLYLGRRGNWQLPPVTGERGGKGPEYHNEIKRYIMVSLYYNV